MLCSHAVGRPCLCCIEEGYVCDVIVMCDVCCEKASFWQWLGIIRANDSPIRFFCDLKLFSCCSAAAVFLPIHGKL